MHEKKGIFFIGICDLYPYLSSTFKHNTVMILVTENGSGLTLGWSGTPQFNKISLQPKLSYKTRFRI